MSASDHPWSTIVHRNGRMSFAAPILVPPEKPGENTAGNVADGVVESAEHGFLTIKFAQKVKIAGTSKVVEYRVTIPAHLLVSFLEAEEKNAPVVLVGQ